MVSIPATINEHWRLLTHEEYVQKMTNPEYKIPPLVCTCPLHYQIGSTALHYNLCGNCGRPKGY